MRFAASLALSILVLASSAAAGPPDTFAAHTGRVPRWSLARTDSVSPSPAPEAAHRGLYVRAAAGSGLINIDVNPEPGHEDDRANAAALSLDVLAGASAARGAAFGGALLLDFAPSMPLGPDESAYGSLGLALVGPFADVFPDADSGRHFGGTLGFAGIALETVDAHHHRMLGFGGALWGGNEWSIGDEWSAGVGLRLLHTQTRGDAAAVDLNAFSFSTSLMLTLLHH
jgi:hypothetical protein